MTIMPKRTDASVSLRAHQEELLQLSELAGIHADPQILKIIIELLNMKVPPQAIYAMLKTIRKSNVKRYNSATTSSSSKN